MLLVVEGLVGRVDEQRGSCEKLFRMNSRVSARESVDVHVDGRV